MNVEALFPRMSLFPLPIEQEALRTQRSEETEIAVAVGLDAETLQACAGAIGDGVNLVVTHESGAASDLVAILRPRLVLVSSSLAPSDATRLELAALSSGTYLVLIEGGATFDAVAVLVAAALTFLWRAAAGDSSAGGVPHHEERA